MSDTPPPMEQGDPGPQLLEEPDEFDFATAPEDNVRPIRDGIEVDTPGEFQATPFAWRDSADIPPRQWLYGRHLIRKFLSLDIAAGGLGKSSVKVVEALALTTGKPLLGKEVHGGPFSVWLYNLEDPDEETERRIHAAAVRHNVGPDQVGDRLYVNSGRDQPLCIAEETDSGARIIRPVVDALTAEIHKRGIDVLILDPFVSSHMVSENDNRAIDMVAKEWSRIADQCNCSINLVHHIRKNGVNEVTADSSRGAVSLIGAARSVVVYNRMTPEEAERANIPPDQRSFYFRTQTDKANLAPPDKADWHRMNTEHLPNGDSVGVACSWSWPDAFEGLSLNAINEILSTIEAGLGDGERYTAQAQPRAVESGRWAGSLLTERGKTEASAKDIIRQWLRTGVLVEEEYRSLQTRKTKRGLTAPEGMRPC
jgi:hypothetical protein